MAKGTRKNITIPGALAPALHLRFREFGFRTLSPFVLDLVTYDLRSGAKHAITLAIASDAQAAQDAVDKELVVRYRPGQPRAGLLVEVIERLSEIRSLARQATPVPLIISKPERVTFPARIWPLVEPRGVELGYASLSAYITGLIRYDLLISGPHQSLMPPSDRAAQDAVARETIARRKRGQRRKLYLDHLIERVEGRALNETELDTMKGKIALHLRAVLQTP